MQPPNNVQAAIVLQERTFLFMVVWWGMKKCMYIKVRVVGRCAVTDVVRLAAVWAICSAATAYITTTRRFHLESFIVV